jgi:hypothetical protein
MGVSRAKSFTSGAKNHVAITLGAHGLSIAFQECCPEMQNKEKFDMETS